MSWLEQIMAGTKIRTGFIQSNQGVTQFCSSVPSKIKMGSGFWKKWAPFALFSRCKNHNTILATILQNRWNAGTDPYI